MAADPIFPRLVSLACHDLRTPLATVYGFARTLPRLGPLPEQATQYIGMMEAASAEMVDLLDRLSLVARIESGSYEPTVADVDSLELARGAGGRATSADVDEDGEGEQVAVDRDWTERAIAFLADCAIRHGDAERVRIGVRGRELELAPVSGAAAQVLLGAQLRDVGAETARRLLEALGGSLSLRGEALVISLPAT